MSRLQEHYEKVVRQALVEEFSYRNSMQVPKLEKIVVNMGVGEALIANGQRENPISSAIAYNHCTVIKND